MVMIPAMHPNNESRCESPKVARVPDMPNMDARSIIRKSNLRL